MMRVFADSFTLELENDLLYNTDNLYTHGTRLTYGERDINWVLGQNIYTPKELSYTHPITNDRPYAGTAYIGANKIVPCNDENNSFYGGEVAVGVVGKYSGSEYTQKYIHRLTDSTQPMGWDFQVKDRPMIQTYLKYYRDLFNNNYITIGVYTGNNIGTVASDAGIGATIIMGYNVPSILDKPITSDENVFSSYVFIDRLKKYSFYNTLLDCEYVDITPTDFIDETRSGVGIVYNLFEIKYGYCIRTKEFEEQTTNAKFGTIALKFRF